MIPNGGIPDIVLVKSLTVCATCGKEFKGRTRHSTPEKFCSRVCSQKFARTHKKILHSSNPLSAKNSATNRLTKAEGLIPLKSVRKVGSEKDGIDAVALEPLGTTDDLFHAMSNADDLTRLRKALNSEIRFLKLTDMFKRIHDNDITTHAKSKSL
jgi:hypothetical protein